MKVVTAHSVKFSTAAGGDGLVMMTQWPSWTAVYQDADSAISKLMHAVGAPLGQFSQELLAWRLTQTPFGAEGYIFDTLHNNHAYEAFPRRFMKDVRYIMIPDSLDKVRRVFATNAAGRRVEMQYFSKMSWLTAYLESTSIEEMQPWAGMYLWETKLPVPTALGSRYITVRRYLIMSGQFEKIEVICAPDAMHDQEYTLVFHDNQKDYNVVDDRPDSVDMPEADKLREMPRDLKEIGSSHMWNQLDEWGFLFALERLPAEHDALYARRLNDIFQHPANATGIGINNGMARETGLLTHPGRIRVPIVFPGQTEDELGVPLQQNVMTAETPRILRKAKWYQPDTPLQPYDPNNPLVRSRIDQVYEMLPGPVPTTRRSPLLYHLVVHTNGPGGFLISPVPDFVYAVPCTSPGFQPGTVTIKATMGLHPAAPEPNPNFCIIEVEEEVLGLDQLERPYGHDVYLILEYRTQYSRNMWPVQPVLWPIIHQYWGAAPQLAYNPNYIMQALYSRVFAVNEDDYKSVNFEGFNGPADYTEWQRRHYCGSNDLTGQSFSGLTLLKSDALSMLETEVWENDPYGEKKREFIRTWMNRHECFNAVTEQGLCGRTHDDIEKTINDRTRVMWDSFIWGVSFWWDRDIMNDPTHSKAFASPQLENCTEYVPHLWDTEFSPRR